MKLTDQQIKAVNHRNGPCLVLAVPGSGKTSMLLERVKTLSLEIDPKKILSLTFSKSQASDMRNRFDGDSSNFMTIHAFSYLIVRNYLKKFNKEFRLLENDEIFNKYDLIEKIYFKVNGKKISKEDIRLFFQETGFMINNLEDISYLEKVEVKNAKKIYLLYEEFKKNHYLLDFDDMLKMSFKLLDDKKLLKSIKNKYKYFQLDEGQDTSRLQFKILEKIIYPENNLLIVADDDQSIYSFRAANPDYLLNFKNHFADAKIYTLDENHRSQKNIVEVSDKFIKANKNRFPKKVFTKKQGVSKIVLKTLKNSRDEYNFIKNRLVNDRKTAILYRNNISSINLISFLLEDEINFSINADKLDFFESRMFKDITNIISFAYDFKNGEMFSEIYFKIKTFLDKELIDKLELKGENQTVFDFFYEMDLKNYQIEALYFREKDFKHLLKLPLDRQIFFVYNYMGYKKYANILTRKNKEESFNKDVFIESLINLSHGLNNINELNQRIEKIKKIIKLKKKSNLTLSTIHSSKGLEYDDVFIIDMVKNEFPIIDERDDNLEEERRIFYVAMTRAKENLTILSLKQRNKKNVLPSIFFENIKSRHS